MSLVYELIKDLLPEQEKKKVVAVYGGGFKPPTKGHFKVVKQAIEENPNIDEFVINIGGKERDGVTPEESIQIWDIYKQYLPVSANINIKYSSVPPIKATYDYAKNNPDEDVLFILGAREGNEDDFKDIAARTTKLDNYPNLELRTIITKGGSSGTAARQAGKISKEKLIPYLPDELKDFEIDQVYQMISDKVTEGRKKKKDPKKGTGKKPKGSGRRLYTDEDPKDTVGIKFSTRQDIVDTLNKKSFKAKSHARQSQIINLIHQRVRAALGRTKDPAKKKKLRSGFEYIKKRKEASKKKTQRLKKLKESKPFKREGTTFKVGQVLTFKGKKNRKTGSAFSKTNPLRPLPPQRDFPVEVVKVEWKEAGVHSSKSEYFYTLQLLRDLSSQKKRGLKMPFQSEEEIKRRLADKQLTRAEFERQATRRKDSFDKPITYKSVGHFEENDKDYFGLNKLIREIVEEPKYKIFSDMDGVLTDFEGRFEKYSDGMKPADYEKKFGKDKFWELVDGEGVAFWVGMPWMSDGERYWDYIKDYDTQLLSSPSRSNTSRLGKRLWVRNNMPGVKLTLAQAYLKKNYAAPNHILIDDRKSNIDEWRAEGGIGILHTSAADTIRQLKDLGL